MAQEFDESNDLLQRAASGDPQAVQDLFARHRDRLKRMVHLRLSRRLQGRVDDSDVIQEAFLSISCRLNEYVADPKLPFFLWLRHMTGLKLAEIHRRHLGSQLRDADREVTLHRGGLPEVDSISLAAHLLGQLTTPSQAAIKAETRLIVQEALNNMDPTDREVLALKHFEQLSTSEIAEVLGMSKAGAGSRYLRHQTAQRDPLSNTWLHGVKVAAFARTRVSQGMRPAFWRTRLHVSSNRGSLMAFSESRSELIMELAEEFLERYRKGEKPPLKEYIDRHPELAAEIKDVFPAMAMMENIAVADDSMEERQAPTVSATPEISFKQLGDYRIIREIGHGGMGVVYEAEQVSLGRHVALKVLANQTLKDAKHKRRFEREARAAAKLHHTNIVPVFGVGEHDGLPYYVMQFIQGLGLDAVLDELKKIQTGTAPTGSPAGGELRISRRDVSAADMARSLLTGAFQQSADGEAGDPKPDPAFAATLDQPGDSLRSAASPAQADSQPLSDTFTLSSSSIILPGTSSTGRKADAKKQTYWQSVANIGRQIADALEYAHKQGVQHRDVKPSNLLLDLRGTVWVTDFGLAKVAGPGAEDLTHTGDILGTLRYMPPEAFEGKTDARSDVYALGLTLYELLAMKPAFNERDRNKLIKQVTSGEPTPLDQVRREVPRDLVTIIQKSIAREPSRRYATAEELAADLQRFLDDEPILARRQTRRERYVRWARHNPGIAVLGGVLTAVLVLVTIASLLVAGHFSRSAQREREARQAESSQRQIAEETAQQAKALGLVQLILNVDTSKVLPYVAQLPEHRQWSDPLLREVFDQAADKSQQKLHAGLALLPVDPGQVDYLLGRLLDADPQVELAVIRDALAPQKDRLLDRLWAVAEKPQQGYDAQRLRGGGVGQVRPGQ